MLDASVTEFRFWSVSIEKSYVEAPPGGLTPELISSLSINALNHTYTRIQCCTSGLHGRNETEQRNRRKLQSTVMNERIDDTVEANIGDDTRK